MGGEHTKFYVTWLLLLLIIVSIFKIINKKYLYYVNSYEISFHFAFLKRNRTFQTNSKVCKVESWNSAGLFPLGFLIFEKWSNFYTTISLSVIVYTG